MFENIKHMICSKTLQFFTQQGGAKQNPIFCSLKHWMDVSFYLDIQACTHIYWPFCLDTERSFIIPCATNFFTSKIANFCQQNGLWNRLICAVDYVEIISEDPRITTLHAIRMWPMNYNHVTICFRWIKNLLLLFVNNYFVFYFSVYYVSL